MLIKSIKMNNFRQYKGEQSLSFIKGKESNVTVILGDNTSGKTTLLQAFNWCLYGKARFDTSNFLLNYEVSKSLSMGRQSTVKVELEIIHGDVEYTVTREQVYSRKVNDVIGAMSELKVDIKDPDHNYQTDTIEDLKAQEKVNEILPQELSDYFFFDTERIQSISTKKDIAKAVKTLLGLTLLENTLEHLGKKTIKKSVIGNWYASLDTEKDETAEKIQKEITIADEKLKDVTEKITSHENQIKHYQTRKEEYEKQLAENANTKIYQNQRKSKENDIKHEEVTLEGYIKEFSKKMGRTAVSFFAGPVIEKTNKFLSESDLSDKGIPDMNAKSIEAIMKRGKCVCGTDIKEGSAAYKHLMMEREYLPPKSIGTLLRNFKKELRMNKIQADNFYKEIEACYTRIIRSRQRLGELNDELTRLSELVKNAKDMTVVENRLTDTKIKLKDFTNKKDACSVQKGRFENEIAVKREAYEKIVSKTDKNKEILECINYAEEIYKWVEISLNDKQDTLREELEEKVNKIFSEMYHGSRIVEIDEKYNVKLITLLNNEKIKTDESKGLESVKNFAFIAGLVELAKEKVTSESDGGGLIEISSEPYPLVMDAPFSNADEKHVKNISLKLPEIAEQVIMFVMEKDYNYAKAFMGTKVGKRYKLDKKSETLTYIVEEK